MKRTIGVLLGLGLVLSGCGGGDGEAGDGQSPIGSGGAGGAAGAGGTAGAGDAAGAGGDAGIGGQNYEGACAPQETGDATFDAVVAVYAGYLKGAGGPGGAIAVLDHGKLRVATFGSKLKDTCSPIATTDLFRVPGISRVVTAAAVLAAVDEGKIALDDPVTKFVPELSVARVDGAGPLTVHHLLTQTSGLPVGGACSSLDELGAKQFGQAWSAPGELFNNEAPDDLLAGLVLQRATKQKYAEAVRSRLFEPLGIQATFDAAEAAGRAHTDGDNPIDSKDCESMQPYTQLFASIEDMGKLLEIVAAEGAPILPADLGARLLDPQGVHHYTGESSTYGMVTVDAWLPGSTWAGAWDAGYSAEIDVYRDQDLAYVLLANSQQVYPFQAPIDDAYPADLSNNPFVADPATYPSLAGTYVDDIGYGALTKRTAVVTARDGKLWSNVDDLGERELVPDGYKAPDNFDMDFGADGNPQIVHVRFWRDAAGKGSKISSGASWPGVPSGGPPFRRVP